MKNARHGPRVYGRAVLLAFTAEKSEMQECKIKERNEIAIDKFAFLNSHSFTFRMALRIRSGCGSTLSGTGDNTVRGAVKAGKCKCHDASSMRVPIDQTGARDTDNALRPECNSKFSIGNCLVLARVYL